jgi:hypothetical protein
MITRFMQVMFSAAENNDEELTSQVANDIETAKASEEGSGVEDDEVSYVNLGSGKVLITDKGTGEATVAEQSEEDPEQYDLEGFENDEDLEKYLHTLDGVTPDENIHDSVTEDFEDHMTGEDVISPNLEDGGLNPEAGHEGSVTEVTPEDDKEEECEEDDEEKVYSVTMTEEELNMFSEYCESLANSANTASTKVFSDPEFYAKIFSDVLDEDKPAVLGDLKIEKTDDDTIVVTDLESGDEAQVTVNEDDEFVVNDVQKELSEDEKVYSVTMTEEELNMFSEYCERLYSDNDEEEDEPEVDEEECEEKECEGDQYEPLFVVGIDPVNHVIVDSPVYSEEDANALAQRFAEDGVEAVEIFDCPDAARDHAVSLLGEAGVTEIEQVAEPQEHEFSDVTIYTTRYFTDCTEFMFKLFSETDEDIHDTQENIEEAIKSGDQKETDSEVITPIDDETAVVHDKDTDEYTKVTLTDEDINTEKLTEEEADDLLDKDIEEKEDEEKEFSVVNKFFADVDAAAAQQQASFAPAQSVDASQINPETGDPVNVEPTAAPAQSVEVVEDKALAAVQSIQEAANEAVLAIAEAKDAPAPGEESDLKEAQFSETKTTVNDTLTSWFENNI